MTNLIMSDPFCAHDQDRTVNFEFGLVQARMYVEGNMRGMEASLGEDAHDDGWWFTPFEYDDRNDLDEPQGPFNTLEAAKEAASAWLHDFQN